jgi:hypothetical protein
MDLDFALSWLGLCAIAFGFVQLTHGVFLLVSWIGDALEFHKEKTRLKRENELVNLRLGK